MDASLITALATAATMLGLGRLIPAAIRWFSGASHREKSRFQEILHDRTVAEAARDSEAEWRRTLQDYCSTLRQLLIEHGVPMDRIPPWPKRNTDK